MSSSSRSAAGDPGQAHADVALGAVNRGTLLRGTEIGELDGLATPDLREAGVEAGTGSMLRATELADSLLGRVAEEARAAARAQGYSIGWAQGRQVAAAEAAQVAEEVAARHAEAEAQRAAEHADALAALAKAATEVRGLLAELSARIEEQAIGLAWELTAAIVEREVAVADSADTVRRVLRVLSPGAVGTVRLHPAVVSDEAAEALRGAGLTVIADPALGRADALIERDGRVVDLRISEALERVRQVLA